MQLNKLATLAEATAQKLLGLDIVHDVFLFGSMSRYALKRVLIKDGPRSNIYEYYWTSRPCQEDEVPDTPGDIDLLVTVDVPLQDLINMLEWQFMVKQGPYAIDIQEFCDAFRIRGAVADELAKLDPTKELVDIVLMPADFSMSVLVKWAEAIKVMDDTKFLRTIKDDFMVARVVEEQVQFQVPRLIPWVDAILQYEETAFHDMDLTADELHDVVDVIREVGVFLSKEDADSRWQRMSDRWGDRFEFEMLGAERYAIVKDKTLGFGATFAQLTQLEDPTMTDQDTEKLGRLMDRFEKIVSNG